MRIAVITILLAVAAGFTVQGAEKPGSKSSGKKAGPERVKEREEAQGRELKHAASSAASSAQDPSSVSPEEMRDKAKTLLMRTLKQALIAKGLSHTPSVIAVDAVKDGGSDEGSQTKRFILPYIRHASSARDSVVRAVLDTQEGGLILVPRGDISQDRVTFIDIVHAYPQELRSFIQKEVENDGLQKLKHAASSVASLAQDPSSVSPEEMRDKAKTLLMRTLKKALIAEGLSHTLAVIPVDVVIDAGSQTKRLTFPYIRHARSARDRVVGVVMDTSQQDGFMLVPRGDISQNGVTFIDIVHAYPQELRSLIQKGVENDGLQKEY